MPGDTKYDVVLLYGPPVQNKTSYVPSSYFKEEFSILSPEKIFRENPALGLRDLTLQVVSTLKENKQVFIEDEFRLKSARNSILSTLKKKVPSCTVLLLKVVPKYGLKQVCWSHQYSFVQHKKLSENYDFSQVRQWFDESELTLTSRSDYVDIPDKKEGFDIDEISIPLKVPSTFKFETPCLFIQWEAAVSSSGDVHLIIQDVVSKWKANNPWGRLIFIYDGKIRFRESEEIASVKRYMQDLSEKINYPVYVLRVKSLARISSFCVPPQPGILAFLQFQHCVDLHSKQTTYIYETVDHMNMAQAAGVRHVKGNKIQIHPDTVFTKQTTGQQIPSMLKNIVYIEEGQPGLPLTLPLYDQCHDMVQGCLSQSYENGLLLSVYVPSKESFLSAQETLTESLVRSQRLPSGGSSPEETQLQPKQNPVTNTDQELPVWMGKRLRRESTLESISSVENDSYAEPSTSYRCSKTVYVMTEKELQELACQVLAQAGKEVNISKIHQL